MLWPFMLALVLLTATGLLALAAGRSDRAALAIGTAGCVLASICGVVAAGNLLLAGASAEVLGSWRAPLGELRIGVDALTAFFLLCIYWVSGLGALYGAAYLRDHAHGRRVAPAVFFFNLLVASMTGVVLARDGVLFLVAWELMSFAGFFLVTFDHDREDVRRAGMVYLVASQVGAVFLLVLFGLLARHAGTFSFAGFAAAGAPALSLANACFVLAVIGFGTKAGFWGLHTWLPEAHPAAPSHVSATMSGVMIKLGIYGLLRTLTFLGTPPSWWGIILIGIGGASGVLGVLHALGQHDLKRLLAYHSVENIGIITLGLGLGVLGQSAGNAGLAFLGYGGAILHTLNHGLFKGLLFHGAGSVLWATHTKEIDALGGLARKMPLTALTFLVGALAISGLPPFNGFVSEWLIYVSAFRASNLHGASAVAALAVIPILALIGGLAAACFVKAYGVVFLGAPRSSHGAQAKDPPLAMRFVMVLGALSCLAIGVWPAAAFRLVQRPAQWLAGAPQVADPALLLLEPITRVALLVLALVALLTFVRWLLLRRRAPAAAPTWGCGYEAPTARMQYTAASFAEPVLGPFEPLLDGERHEQPPEGFFPQQARYEQHPGDVAADRIIAPAIRLLLASLGRLRILQRGRVQVYIAYIFVTVVVVLIWQLAGGAR